MAYLAPDQYVQYFPDAAKIPSDIHKIEGIYEATATILALVSFGSVLGVRLSTNRHAAGLQQGGLILVFGGSFLVIIIQVLVLGGLCCGSLSTIQYLAYITLTGLALIEMVGGYAVIVYGQSGMASSRMAHTKKARSAVNKKARSAGNRTGRRTPKTGRSKSGTGSSHAGKPSTERRARTRRTSDSNTLKEH